MKKYLLVLLFILVLLIAISGVSASDSNSLADDSAISEASLDDDVQSVDGEVESTVGDQQNNEDVLSERGNDETPVVNVDTVTINENNIPYVPFNVTNAQGDIISGGVNVTISGKDNSISKYIEVNNVTGQSNFNLIDLIKIIESNKGCNISDIYNIIYSSVNFTNANISEVIYGLEEIYEGSDINIDEFMEGTGYITNGTNLNREKFIEGINYILDDIKMDHSKIIEGLNKLFGGIVINEHNIIQDLSNYFIESGVNMSEVNDELRAIVDGFNVTRSDLDNILAGIHLDKTLFAKGLVGVFKDLNIKITPSMLINILKRNFAAVFKEVLPKILSKDTIYKILDPNFDRVDFVNSLNYLKSAVTVDFDKVSNSIIKIYNKFNFNSSEIIDRIDKISQELNLNSSEFKKVLNDTIKNNIHIDDLMISEGVTKVIAALNLNKTRVNEGLAMMISAFTFNKSLIDKGVAKVIGAVSFNEQKVENGINNVVNGLCINTSSIITQLISKFGYIATFNDYLAPGIYNVTVRYFGDGSYASAINDTSKLIVLPKINTPIKLGYVVDGGHVYIKGNLDPDAKGLVLFEMGDYNRFDLIVDGKVAFDDVFEPGDYNMKVFYLGDSKFNQNSTSFSFIVKSPTQIVVSQVKTTYGTSKKLVVALKDYAGKMVVGKTVKVKLNGKLYSGVTNAKGQISVSVPANLKPNTYTASIAFAGDDKYVKSTGSVKVVVAKATPKITAAKKTFKVSTKTKKYTIALKANNKAMKNTKVTIKVKGVTYSAKTNSAGKATFKITKLTKKGTFKSVITYKGNNYYNKVTKAVNIVVK